MLQKEIKAKVKRFCQKYLSPLFKPMPFRYFFMLKSVPNFYKFVFAPQPHVFNKSPGITARRGELTFYLKLKYLCDWRIYFNAFPSSTFRLFREIKPADWILDVGANNGYYTLQFAKAATAGRVFSLEPDPQNYRRLLKNIELNPKFAAQIDSYQLGLAEKSKKVQIEVCDPNNLGKNRVKETGVEGNLTQLIALDEFIESNRIQKVDWVKVDIEGYEPFFLEGATKTISRFKPNLYMELSDVTLRYYNSSAQQLIDKLIELGATSIIHAETLLPIASIETLEDCFFDIVVKFK